MNLTKSVGIFEAKTHFSQLCDKVSSTGQPLTVERRGKPLVVIAPVPTVGPEEGTGILSAWKAWKSTHPEEDSDFPEVTEMRVSKIAPDVD